MAQDIAEKSFWTKIPFLQPYALLARWDRPIGFWLTLWPALWSMFLTPSFKLLNFQQHVWFIALFAVGAFVVRGAGCTINDITDRHLDQRVERTKARPLASGRLSLNKAIAFLIVQLAIGAWVLFHLSPMAIYIGLAALPLIIVYPWMKRITWWPQVFLAIVFNAGALIGWAAMENSLTTLPVLVYLSAFFWTIAYDTVYAHLDADDDALIGIKSTARLWGADSKSYILVCWLAFLALFLVALVMAKTNWLGLFMFSLDAVVLITAHSFWNPLNMRYTLGLFRLQAKIGMILALATLAPLLF